MAKKKAKVVKKTEQKSIPYTATEVAATSPKPYKKPPHELTDLIKALGNVLVHIGEQNATIIAELTTLRISQNPPPNQRIKAWETWEKAVRGQETPTEAPRELPKPAIVTPAPPVAAPTAPPGPIHIDMGNPPPGSIGGGSPSNMIGDIDASHMTDRSRDRMLGR